MGGRDQSRSGAAPARRTTGVTRRPEQLRPHDHAAWTYDDPGRFVDDALTFLRAGLERGERVGYVGSVGLDHVAGELAALAPVGRTDATFVLDVDAVYQGGAPEPRAQVATYVEATREAVDDGYTGLRVAADVTPLVLDDDAAEAFARYEHLIDHEIAGMPSTALCGLDRRVVGRKALALACLHPTTNDARSTFGLFAAGGGAVGFRGDLDIGDEADLSAALDRVAWPPDGVGVVDAVDVGHLDHRALRVLQARLCEVDAATLVRTRAPLVADLVALLQYDRIDVEVVP